MAVGSYSKYQSHSETYILNYATHKSWFNPDDSFFIWNFKRMHVILLHTITNRRKTHHPLQNKGGKENDGKIQYRGGHSPATWSPCTVGIRSCWPTHPPVTLHQVHWISPTKSHWKYVCPKFKVYLSKFKYVFVQIVNGICPDYKMYVGPLSHQ